MKVEIGNVYYNPKGKYKFVIVGRTLKQSIDACKWYAIRDTFHCISLIWQSQIDACKYLGKSSGLYTLFEVKEKQNDKDKTL